MYVNSSQKDVRVIGWLKEKWAREGRPIWSDPQPNPVAARFRGDGLSETDPDVQVHGPWPKGTAPEMTADLEKVISLVQERMPTLRWEQQRVSLPADDDGLWFFWIPDKPGEVQIESSSGSCPFLIETDKHDNRLTADSPDAAAEIIVEWLCMPGGREESPWHAQ